MSGLRPPGLAKAFGLDARQPHTYIRKIMRTSSYYFAYFWFSSVTGGQRGERA
jgi:hypothetical protein